MAANDPKSASNGGQAAASRYAGTIVTERNIAVGISKKRSTGAQH
jgi:hypothetical protein